VERVKEYLDVEQEAAATIAETKPPSNWPSRGSVEFIGYTTRYRPDFDTVLKDVTFKILPGEKVGVVGRTGAGKSSMALALFRALEAEKGKILVDDVDVGLIGLQDLRENIVMVPQGKYFPSAITCQSVLTSTRSDTVHRHDPKQSRSVFHLHRRRNLYRPPRGSSHLTHITASIWCDHSHGR
jgi:ABC-type bacteriocin/lantibiotic exporter with double-glycine peptidase domain